MGARTEYTPGTFSYVDLSTTDPDAAKLFYGELFGWGFDDQEVGDGMVYTTCRVDGATACAISAQMEQERQMGVPPHWNNYVTVQDADAVAEQAKQAGANIMMEPFDVMNAGRMAIFADPTGAVLCIWQPRENIGAEIVNAPGALAWNELHTADIQVAESFYGKLFGWSFDAMDTPAGAPVYHVIRNGERRNGGVMATQPQEPPNWMPYFAAEDLDASMDKLKQLGGHVHAGPIPFPQGRIAVCADSQGAFFSLWEGELEN
jgi:predicted enzyme related to lactoylglutathione lyase